MRITLAAFIFGAAMAPVTGFGQSPSLICSAVPDPPDDKGGGGDGKTGKGGKDGDELSQGHLDAINAIVKTQLGRLDISGMVAKAVGDATPKIVDAVTKAITPGDDDGKGGDGKTGKGGKDAGGDMPASVKNAIAQMSAKVDDLTSQLKAKDDELKRVANETRDRETSSLFANAIATVGVKEKLRNGALAQLRSSAKIKYDDKGQPIVEVERNRHGTRYTDEISVDAYVKEWAASDEGKEYLPAPGGRGSGVGSRVIGGGGQVVTGGQRGQGGQGSPNGRQQQDPGISDAEFGQAVLDAYAAGGAD